MQNAHDALVRLRRAPDARRVARTEVVIPPHAAAAAAAAELPPTPLPRPPPSLPPSTRHPSEPIQCAQLKKSIGFNWGPCATGCSYWTGVRLGDLLKAAGIKTPEDGAHYVSFRGPLGELPKGDDGSYGTSVTYWTAMDPAQDVIVAYKQNGRCAGCCPPGRPGVRACSR